ncbi:TolC family protein [Capnocytophaga canimorsus]|uniref:TolC family protein n=1 Tax=Capnocytophaga canimorsus TaxID=28188 RepID=UPI000D6E5FCF|nr:TolC family protein [Capnocytophaga canimorsus]AWL79012.1 TolC family protein [Capnocytophaga canimorsus]AYW37610.1 TolC family protein [Capnocytophaga canimorsus]MDT9499011.1 TolC family protein [Capnocytophaga canimorsus]
MKRFIFISLSLIAVGVQAQSLSFSEALDNMYNGNQKRKGMEKQSQAADFGAKAFQGLYFPQISLNASYVHMSDHLYLDFNEYRNRFGAHFQQSPLLKLPGFKEFLMPYFQQDWKYQFQNQNIGKFSLDVKWPIFTGGKIRAAVAAGKIQSEIARIETQKTENKLISELAERYFQTQLANAAFQVRKQALQTAENHLYNAQKLEANGMLAPVEAMQAQTAVADAQREVMAAEKDIQLAKTALYGVMGNTEGDFTELSTPLFEVTPLESLVYYQKAAKENFPEIVQAKLKKALAQQNLKVQKSNYLPDVALMGKKYLWTENLPITEPDNWVVGVGLQWDIFKGLQNKHHTQQAKALSESVDLLTAQAEKDIQTLVKKYYTEIEKQREQLQSLEKSLEFAQELIRVRNKAFTEGFGTSTDVADANLYRAAIQIKRYKALFEMDKTLAQLLEICGLSHKFVQYIP